MFFTLIFNDTRLEGPTICVDLVFRPSPVWRIGEWEYVPDAQRPRYHQGYLQDIEVREGGLLSRIDHSSAMRDIRVTLVCHPQGLGTEEDLKLLLDDLSGYDVNVIRPVE